MPRAIIQDSDDDGNFGSVSPWSEKASARRDHLIQDESLRSQQSAPGGTSSTEVIQREIVAAHREVLEKSAVQPSALNGYSSSPLVHRRNTTLETGHGSSLTKSHRRSTMVTYGSSSRRAQSMFEDEAFESMREPVDVDMEARLDSSPGDVEFIIPRDAVQEPPGRSEERHVIGRSLQPDFAGHEPRMFGTSDTVPDGTMDQQHLVDAAIAHFTRTHEEATGIRERQSLGNDPSPPWSDYIQSPENVNSTKEVTGVSSTPHSTPRPNPVLRRSKTLGNPRTPQPYLESRNTSPQEIPSSTNMKKRRASLAPVGSQSSSHSAKKPRREQVDDMGELAHFNDPSMTMSQKVHHSIKDSIHAVRASRAAKAQQGTSSEIPNSDDVLVGLPKERYQPRPSRSRSSRLAIEEPIDYSLNPENAAKKKAKRRKTEDAATIGRVKLSMAEKRERIAGTGFSPNSSRKAMKECKYDLDKAAEARSNADHREATKIEDADEFDIVSDNNVEAQADLEVKRTVFRAQRGPIVLIEKSTNSAATENCDANMNPPKKKRGRPPKVQPSDMPEKTKVLADVTHEAIESHDKVKTEHHAENTNLAMEVHRQSASSLARRPSPTVNPTPSRSAQQPAMTAESNKLEERAAEILEAQESLPKKRGRGRPRKHEPTTPNKHETTKSDIQATRGLELPDDPNSEEPEKQAPGHGSIREAPVSTPHAVMSSQSGSALQPSTANALETPKNANAPAASRSSVSTSKVTYRVGLSKRAKIAPLLKIVKK